MSHSEISTDNNLNSLNSTANTNIDKNNHNQNNGNYGIKLITNSNQNGIFHPIILNSNHIGGNFYKPIINQIGIPQNQNFIFPPVFQPKIANNGIKFEVPQQNSLINVNDYKKVYVGKFPPSISDNYMRKLLEVS